MSTKAKGVYAINSDWSSGNLIYFEKAYGMTTTGNILKIGTTAVQVGDTAQAVDLSWYATGALSAVISASGATFTLAGIAVSTNKTVTFTASADSAAVADQVSLGGYDISAGHRALALSSEEVVVAEVDETKFSDKLPVRINGTTYYIMLTVS